jgi:hypothetical protein
MPFMVMYRTSDGTSCHEQTDAIDEAALLVERLRNKDGIEDDIRIYRMEEISFAFRPYYKVELGLPERQSAAAPPPDVVGTAAEPPAPAAEARAAAAEPSATTEPRSEPRAVADRPTSAPTTDADANGRRGLFGR